MKRRMKWMSVVLLSSSFLLGACETSEDSEQPGSEMIDQDTGVEEAISEENSTTQESSEEDNYQDMNHGEMAHDESGDIPEGLEEAQNPTFPVSSEVTIQGDHMPGMQGAKGIIEGAFDTTAYEVTYPDTETGETVSNHKWVVHEEVENPQDEPYQEGDEVVLAAYHMPGMEGAQATIDAAEDTIVYMVTYTNSETDETVENHKWLTEDELDSTE